MAGSNKIKSSSPEQFVPPNDISAEVSVIGSMVLDSVAIDIAAQIIKAEHFYRPVHGEIFSAILDMRNSCRPIDLVLLRDELTRRGRLADIGGVEYLVDVVQSVPSAANVEYYARLVRDKAMLRAIIRAGWAMVEEATDVRADVESVMESTEKRILDIGAERTGSNAVMLKDSIMQTFEFLEKTTGQHLTGAASGYDMLDNLTCGFQNGEMIVLAARPSMGKTSLLMNIAEYMAVIEKIPLAVFSLEMSLGQLTQRLLSSHARVDLGKIRRSMIGADDWAALQTAAGNLSVAPMIIDDSGGLTITQLRARSRRYCTIHGIKAIFVDYLQLMQAARRSDNRQEDVADISRGIKSLAKELNIPIIAAAQLSRKPADRTGHRPMMSDLRESGSIEQDADVVLLMHREDYYHQGEDGYVPTGVTELIIAKQRNGPTDVVPLVFLPACTRFESASIERA